MNIIALAILVTIVGALPFGLVNLTVLDVSYRDGNRNAMRIANGAAWVEVLFGLIALLAGSLISQNIEKNLVIKYLVLMIPAIVGIIFLFKKNSRQVNRKISSTGFFQGAFLNLISIQVFMFWLLAITYLNTRHLLKDNTLTVVLFITGIWLGKMAVLWIYSTFSHKILSRSNFLARHMNQFIGSLLLIIAVIQLLK